MQTLKTAAIVVLLMTVMYGAYVSLTTPPETLPPDVEEMLQFDGGSLAIDAGLPASLGQLEINTGTAVAGGESADTLGSIASDELPPAIGAAKGAIAASENAGSETPADKPGMAVAVQDGGFRTTLTDSTAGEADAAMTISAAEMNPSAVAMVQQASSEARAATNSSPRSYPATNSTFDLPDPNSVGSSFGSPRDANLALTSGTSDSPGFGLPPTRDGISQVAALERTGGVDQTGEASGGAVPGGRNLGLANAIRTADRLYASDQHKEALATLSIFYNTPNLSGEERTELLTRLDPLARDVIYSRRHLLEQPYRVGQSETLMEVASRYEVPWQLLANINEIKDPVTVLPGTELKVVRGPFRAEVNMTMKELTLFLGDLYAGRFPIGIGNDPAPKPGTFTIQDKQTTRTYYDAAGSPIPPGSPGNPYGEVWLDLGGQLCIHGSPNPTTPTEQGCISLAADFADDLYGILSQGSSVTIRR